MAVLVFGIYLCDHDRDCLTNLRFADDVMLFATSKEQTRKMMCDFKKATEKVGLSIHPDKTKILCNWSTINSDQETTEIKSRIRAAWATFHKHRQELTSRNYMLKHRLRLFDAATTPTICYASGTWAPTKEHERRIQSAQRKMHRLITQTKKRYKKLVKHKVKTSEDLNDIDSSSADDESEDGKKRYISQRPGQ